MTTPNPPQIGTKSGTLPQDSTPFERRQNTIIQLHNRKVREVFRDVFDIPTDGIPYDPSKITPVNSPRRVLRADLLIEDGDSFADMWLKRELLVLIDDDPIPTGYSIPFQMFNDEVRFNPQIHLRFCQNYRDVVDDQAAVEAEVKIRIMGETEATLTPAKSNIYAQKIKTLFGAAGGFRWQKGKGMFTYAEPKKGYFLQLLVVSKAEGRRVAEQILDIQSHTPDWKFANYKENEEPTEAYPSIPPLKQIYGKSRRTPRRRPIASVRFRSAFLHIDGLPNPIVLYDNSGYYKTAILKD